MKYSNRSVRGKSDSSSMPNTIGDKSYRAGAWDTRDPFLDKEASRVASKIGIRTDQWGDIGDAFRHYWASARMTEMFGEDVAHFLVDLNELFGIMGVDDDTRMDYINGLLGVDVGLLNKTDDEKLRIFTDLVIKGEVVVLRSKEPPILRKTNSNDLPPMPERREGLKAGQEVKLLHDDNNITRPGIGIA